MEPSELRCPRCSTPLQPVDQAKRLFLCGACHGTALQQQSLVGVLEGMATVLMSHSDPNAPVEPVKDKGAGIACPACGHTMDNEGYMGTRLVFFDRCSCGLMWFDENELQAMATLLARTDARIEEYRRANRERYQEFAQLVDAILKAHAATGLAFAGR
ncbi:hypothetical protein ACFL6C_12765 [Myxococcota bacterium]